jgi:hypothetical protein
MTDEEITRLVASFEETHAVEDYWAFGWRVWPALRIALATDLYFATNYPKSVASSLLNSSARVVPTLRERLEFYVEPVRDFLCWRREVRSGAALESGADADVIVVGSGHRYQRLGGRLVHYPTAPLVERLEDVGLQCQVWQWQEQPADARPAVNVLPAVSLTQRLSSARMKLFGHPSEPAWFAEVADFYLQRVGRSFVWEQATRFAGMCELSRMFERWLLRARPRLVVLDHWYNGPIMAVTMAAKRLGIPVMDIQHGIQEQTHPAYHWWIKQTSSGWDTLPDIFWVWGERTEGLFKTNRLPLEVLRGGSLWLNLWVTGSDTRVQEACRAARSLMGDTGPTLLVTVPYPTDLCLQFLKEIIAQSPENWTWLVRLHPRDSTQPVTLQAELSARGERVRVHAASDWPLYALLRLVDLHVGVDSTCPTEALAFGKATVLISGPAATYFRSYLADGVMFHAPTPESFPAIARHAMAANPDGPRLAGRKVFTTVERDAERAIARLVEIARKDHRASGVARID